MTIQVLQIPRVVLICNVCKLALSGYLEVCPNCLNLLEKLPLAKNEGYHYTNGRYGIELEFYPLPK